MFNVTTAAEVRDLTTLERVKAVLGISGTGEDTYLDILIPQVSAFVCDYLQVAEAEDGSKTLARETLVETFMLREARPLLQLARAPVVSITSIYEDDGDIALTSDDYQATKASGFLRRMAIGSPGLWCARKVVVTYEAGWVLPDNPGRNLPEPIEAAVFDLVKNARAIRSRSADVKVVDIPDVERIEYFANIMNIDGGMPAETAAKLAPYIRIRP